MRWLAVALVAAALQAYAAEQIGTVTDPGATSATVTVPAESPCVFMTTVGTCPLPSACADPEPPEGLDCSGSPKEGPASNVACGPTGARMIEWTWDGRCVDDSPLESFQSFRIYAEPSGPAPPEPPAIPTGGRLEIIAQRFEAGPEWSCDCPGYEEATLEVGARVYIDRTYTFSDLGPYAGHRFLRGANDDKFEDADPFIHVGAVLVAWDERVPPPSWLGDFTGNVVDTNEINAFPVYEAQGPLPGAGRGGGFSNYFVIFP